VKNSYLLIMLLWWCGTVPKSWAQSPMAAVAATAPIAAAPTTKTTSTLEGLWQGKLLMPGGALALTVSAVALTGGEYFAALDVPMQKLNRTPVELQ
jgi:hypothetical protein